VGTETRALARSAWIRRRKAHDGPVLGRTGARSWGWGRASVYGDDYGDAVNDQVLVMAQFESAQAAENAEAILATPGVDGCWIGPSDLSLSLGVHPRARNSNARVHRAVERTLRACRDTGKVPGHAGGSAEEARTLAERGFR
jgi:4-hydroxy-2-oxoheptanedioate aldolase